MEDSEFRKLVDYEARKQLQSDLFREAVEKRKNAILNLDLSQLDLRNGLNLILQISPFSSRSMSITSSM